MNIVRKRLRKIYMSKVRRKMALKQLHDVSLICQYNPKMKQLPIIHAHEGSVSRNQDTKQCCCFIVIKENCIS